MSEYGYEGETAAEFQQRGGNFFQNEANKSFVFNRFVLGCLYENFGERKIRIRGCLVEGGHADFGANSLKSKNQRK